MSLKEKWKDLQEKSSKKIFSCPSCRKKLRVPIRLGKTLLVSCPQCRGQIQIKFEHPFDQLKKIVKSRAFLKKIAIFILLTVALFLALNWYNQLGA